MTILRGRRRGLEVALAGRAFEEALDELQAVLAQQPDFYRGSPAVARLGEDLPSPEQWSRLGSTLTAAGITLEGVCGGAGAERLAAEHALRYEPVAATAETPLREARRLSEAELSPAARSLVADFAGARADIAARRRRLRRSPRIAPWRRAHRPTPFRAAAPRRVRR